jgi:hypothetical protein
MRNIQILAVALSLWASGTMLPQARADNAPTPADVLAASDRARGGGLTGIRWQANLRTEERGRTQVQELTVEARDRDSLVTFHAPPRVRGQMLLMRGRNLWFVRPDVRRPVPISPRQRLLGAASTGDVASTNYAADYRADAMTTRPCGSEHCHVLELSAISDDVTYPHIRYWVSVEREVAVRAEFITSSGRLFRTAEFEYDNTLVYDGTTTPFVSRMVIRDEVGNGETILEYRDIEAVDIPARRFEPQFLVR